MYYYAFKYILIILRLFSSLWLVYKMNLDDMKYPVQTYIVANVNNRCNIYILLIYPYYIIYPETNTTLWFPVDKTNRMLY